MRILFVVHHPLDSRLGGAPGASLAIARHIRDLGHEVFFYSYDDAFGQLAQVTSRHRLLFPWKLARFLAHHARAFDVIDSTTGDTHAWATLPGRAAARQPCIVVRSNGLEHLAHRAFVERVRRGAETMSWRYPLYNGGLHLWEVKRSLVTACGCITLNDAEWRFCVETLGTRPETTRVIPHGLSHYMIDEALRDEARAPSKQVRVVALGNWGEHKGSTDIAGAVELLSTRGRSVSVLVAGANRHAGDVKADFPAALRDEVEVIEQYDHATLPDLLRSQDVMLFPSRFEGFSLALLEAMACGAIPIATPVGSAPSVIDPGINGYLVPEGSPANIADHVERLIESPGLASRMRRAARATAARFRWSATARATVDLYSDVSDMCHGRGNAAPRTAPAVTGLR